MRGFLQVLVEAEREAPASLRGARIDIAAARQAAVRPQTRLLIGHERSPQAGYYIGVLIDNSGSMDGEKSEKAKAFAMVIAEAAKGIRDVEGHVNAFDDDTFIRLGDFRRHAIAALDAGGGNNDAGGLAAAAELALASRKAHRILIMIHDDSPTASTAIALGNLVRTLTRRHGLVLAQVAVDELQTGAFPHFVDFSKMEFTEAVGAFGALLRRLMRRAPMCGQSAFRKASHGVR